MLVGRFVWEKWRRVWYMGRIIEDSTDSAHSSSHHGSEPLPSVSAATAPPVTARTVKVHIHGEHDTNDKWFPLSSANLELLAVIPSQVTAIGELPALNEHVELLLMDEALRDLLAQSPGELLEVQEGEQEEQQTHLTLVGKVAQVLPAHDASLVDIVYPTAYHHVVQERRVHIGNGYIRVISEIEFQDRHRRLERALALVAAASAASSADM